VYVRVLGSAAGGGFPQWNCNCRNCRGVRAGTLRAQARTQSSIAISADFNSWALCNASPDIHRQLAAQFPVDSHAELRSNPIRDILLVDGQLDHTIGLLLLRENREPLRVWSTDLVADDLTEGLPLLRVLSHFCGIDRRRIPLDNAEFEVPSLPGVAIAALAVEGKPAPYSKRRENPEPGDNIALTFRDRTSGRALFYAPGLARVTEPVRQAMHASAAVLVDGTFWSDDEMIATGVSHKRANDIGHVAQSGGGGLIEELARLPADTRRILIHINNTNPILDEASSQRAQLAAAGIEIAVDGMRIEL
jgi:pyrroloquinoline quinone biosynthesis protein B